MADVIRFVESIDASPTVRLDLNDEAHFWTRGFDAALPRLRRSMSSNAMRDGIHVGSSTYDGRTLTIDLETIHADQNLSAIQLQKLWRELDRPTNILMYQPNGLTKPVFFRTFRSDASQLEDVVAQAAMRQFTIELLAEPFALGLKETIAVGVVTNDPAAATRGNYFDVSGVLGDAPAPALFAATSFTGGWIQMAFAARQHGTPSDLTWFKQAESCTLATGTTNPGGGPDAAMSGTGTNNYVRTSFATAAMIDRLSWDIGADHATTVARRALVGTYRVVVAVRRSSAVGEIRAQFLIANEITGDEVVVPATTDRQFVDLGLVSFGSRNQRVGAGGPNLGTAGSISRLTLMASLTGGVGTTLDWDTIFLVPADEMVHTQDLNAALVAGVDGYLTDSANECVTPYAGDPFTTGHTVNRPAVEVAGGWPYLVPEQTNRFVTWMPGGPVTSTVTLAAHYWPRYLTIRPVSS